jgi:hypothetical protein
MKVPLGDDFTGYFVDYGTYRDRQRAYFTLRDARYSLAAATRTAALEGAIYAGLENVTGTHLARDRHRDDGAVLRVERCLIDANRCPAVGLDGLNAAAACVSPRRPRKPIFLIERLFLQRWSTCRCSKLGRRLPAAEFAFQFLHDTQSNIFAISAADDIDADRQTAIGRCATSHNAGRQTPDDRIDRSAFRRLTPGPHLAVFCSWSPHYRAQKRVEWLRAGIHGFSVRRQFVSPGFHLARRMCLEPTAKVIDGRSKTR